MIGSAITKGRSGVGTAAGGSIVNGADVDEEGDEDDDNEGDNGGAVAEGGQMDEAAKQQHKKNMEYVHQMLAFYSKTSHSRPTGFYSMRLRLIKKSDTKSSVVSDYERRV